MKSKLTVSEMAEISMLVALSYTLSWIKLYRMPQGGSVSLEMLPIFLLSFRRGLRIGVIGGVVLGLLKLTIQMVVVHPAQLLLDYPAAFGALGIAGAFKGRAIMSHRKIAYILWMVCGIILGAVCRLIFPTISGAIFFAKSLGVEAWTTKAFIASAIYNSAYMLPSTILCLIFIPVIIRFLPTTINPQHHLS